MQDETKPNLDFSPEEWSIIVGFASWHGAARNRIGWYASAVGPILLFGAYGIWKSDIIALGLAFVSLLAYVAWVSAAEVRGLKEYRSICNKIITFKEAQETPATEAST